VTEAELSCKELVELVTEYVEGVLPHGESLRFEEHLADCDGCAIYLEQMRRTVEATGRLREGALSPDRPPAALLEAFRTWKLTPEGQ
jgi:anti-sigma factor RsiW